jgi:DNA-binding NtrC family response regulator
MKRLEVLLGSLPILAFRLERSATRLGRAPDNDVVLPLPDVADFHATLHCGDDSVVIRAAAGETLLVDGRSTCEAALSAGREVFLGGYRLRLCDEIPGEEDRDRDLIGNTSSLSMPAARIAAVAGTVVTRVIVAGGPDAGTEKEFGETAFLVGRAPDCNIVLNDSSVSARHASLERTPQGIRVRDLGSHNGTFVDDQRIEVMMVTAGARIRLGRSALLLAGPEATTIEPMTESCPPTDGLAEMVGSSPPMRELYSRIREAAASRVPVLLLGETGTGKDLAARAIHSLGDRSGGPFVPINCAALPRDLLESELFGHARGAFTGASAPRSGAFQAADGGTIFLDEIAELPDDLQSKLLRVIEDGFVPRVGGGGSRSDFRVLAATNQDLRARLAKGRFRHDLFFRLAVLEIALPPLRDRESDLPDLIGAFLRDPERATGVEGAGATSFGGGAVDALRNQPWPGNVRELRNLVHRAVLRCPGGTVDGALILELLGDTVAAPASPPQVLEDIEREAIRKALRDCGGQKRAAARRLGIAESTLYEKIRRYGLNLRAGKDG